MATAPLAELAAVGRRHSIDYNVDADPTTAWVRNLAAGIRSGAVLSTDPALLIAEADDLDALAERYERETA